MNNISRDLELEKQVDAYVKGQLNEKEAQDLWEKLLQRPKYLELLKTELGVKAIVEKRSSSGANDQSQTGEEGMLYKIQRSWPWMAAAAAVVILIVAISVLQMDTSGNVQNLALKEINLAENLASAQILRSQTASITPADSLLNRGFQAAISGELSKALSLYDQIITQYGNEPAAVQAYLNKGIIEYNRHEYEAAVSDFRTVLEKVEEPDFTKEKAYWYLGNAYINTGQLKLAREAISNAFAMEGIYEKPASRLLEKLDRQLESAADDS